MPKEIRVIFKQAKSARGELNISYEEMKACRRKIW
ncbi:MAG: hypothetical protein XD84_1316 [Desulfotomaculum sp. 46_80]|nr:MAG: hypothetical protein XD84_1316 [Desulfotomaculum sp. 46_80]